MLGEPSDAYDGDGGIVHVLRKMTCFQVIQVFRQLIFFTSVFFQLPGVMKIHICNHWSDRRIILGSTDQGVKAGSKKGSAWPR